MVVQDCGSDVANAIARRLVLYARRPGYQSQFSPLLDARIHAENPFAGLIDWMQNNLDRPLHVPALAARACLGERNFYIAFLLRPAVRQRILSRPCASKRHARSLMEICR